MVETVVPGTKAPMISVQGVGVQFNLQSRHRSMRDLLLKGSRGPATPRFWALKNISFDVHAGEAIGVVGRNGCGKSTLLKMVAGVMLPDTGTVSLGGGVAPLIEITGGFVPDLTARDNIYLAAGLHGMKQDDVDAIFDDIVDFAEIGGFLDTPFKHLSSGMRVRLAFSVVSQLNEPILIVDEVLAVGDKAFREKCYDRIAEMLVDGRTLFFVSHSDGNLKRFCDRGIYLKDGVLTLDAPIKQVLEAYRKDTSVEEPRRRADTGGAGSSGQGAGSGGHGTGSSSQGAGGSGSSGKDAAEGPGIPFHDVQPDDPYYDDIVWLKGLGVVRGDSKGNFRPTEPISRQALATVLFRLRNGAGASFTCANAPFDDVPGDSVFAGPISWASQTGLIEQIGDRAFGPTHPASRQVVAQALFRLSNPAGDSAAGASRPFPDVPTGSVYALAITWLQEQGVADGDDSGNFRPTEPISRQVLAHFLHGLDARG